MITAVSIQEVGDDRRTLRNWIPQQQADDGDRDGVSSAAAAEIARSSAATLSLSRQSKSLRPRAFRARPVVVAWCEIVTVRSDQKVDTTLEIPRWTSRETTRVSAAQPRRLWTRKLRSYTADDTDKQLDDYYAARIIIIMSSLTLPVGYTAQCGAALYSPSTSESREMKE